MEAGAFGKRRLNGKLRRKLNEKEMDTRSYHSHSYHRYFEGYVEYETKDAGGKRRIVRKYAGPIYRQQISKLAYVFLRAQYSVLFLLMVFLLIYIGGQERVTGGSFLLVISELATILALSALGDTLLVDYLFIPRNMTIGDYKHSSRAVLLRSVITAGCFGADTLFTLLYVGISGWSAGRADWICLAGFLFGAGAALLLYCTEKRIPYEEEKEQERTAEDGGVEILS